MDVSVDRGSKIFEILEKTAEQANIKYGTSTTRVALLPAKFIHILDQHRGGEVSQNLEIPTLAGGSVSLTGEVHVVEALACNLRIDLNILSKYKAIIDLGKNVMTIINILNSGQAFRFTKPRYRFFVTVNSNANGTLPFPLQTLPSKYPTYPTAALAQLMKPIGIISDYTPAKTTKDNDKPRGGSVVWSWSFALLLSLQLRGQGNIQHITTVKLDIFV
ncbi:hypothetical protein PHISCL_06180 [Aspergillus sclerotialis]|uniref:Uncharacterized protein n=1 Tax=Aspergillus sclerotialis TaxID=2070753 RepID=A0A3A2ZU27_9EURO|nr:hypothetical protein PHISCL_06180 [Aspergillus sclerotialis]